MKFLLLCCSNEAGWANLPDATRDEAMERYGQWIREQDEAGCYLYGGKLDDSVTAVTVRFRQGEKRSLDGPFTESKEQIGGFHVIECENRAEALRIAEGIPTLPFGGVVEVRSLQWTLPTQE